MSAYIPAKKSWSIGRSRLPRLSLYIACSVVVLSAIAVLLVQAALVAVAGIRGEDLVQLPSSSSSSITAESASAKRDHGFVVVQGEAVNHGKRTLSSLEAVVELFDRSGVLRGVDSAMVRMPAIAADEESAFEVRMPDPGNIATYRIRFRSLGATPR